MEMKYFTRNVCRCGPDNTKREVSKEVFDNLPVNKRRGISFKGNEIVEDIFELCSDCGGGYVIDNNKVYGTTVYNKSTQPIKSQ